MQKTMYQSKTQLIFILSKLFNSPLGVMYGLLPFILCKNFNIAPFQIAVLVSLKPIIISFYSIVFIKNKPHNLKKMIVFSNVLGFIPCLLFPFFDNNWYYIFSSAIFMISARAMLPAWTEIFKLNIIEEDRGKIFSRGSTTNYLANIFIPLLIAPIIDYYPLAWKWCFFAFACIQFCLIFFLSHLKINEDNFNLYELKEKEPKLSFESLIVEPWRNSWNLLKERPDFRYYQISFLFGGSALILVQPVLPIFFEQVLQLSYTQLAVAVSLCKGVGFTLTSPIWARWFNRISIHLFNSQVIACAGLFAVVLISMGHQIAWIYLAYFIYGIMQAGSEISWHLSGPLFSQGEDSTPFTSVNVAMVGIRGCIVPFVGELIFLYSNSMTVFICSAVLCGIGTAYSLFVNQRLIETNSAFSPSLIKNEY